MPDNLEIAACTSEAASGQGFNQRAEIPYGCTLGHIRSAMKDFTEFLGFINKQLHSKGIPRLECMLMPANFSIIVGEFMAVNIPKYCDGLVRNQYHNGHPDLIPTGKFPGNAVQYTHEGIEIKASRYVKGW